MVQVSASATAADVTLSVRDTGCGIAEADQARVFEKFEQVTGGRMRAAGGTGLGLALTKALVELHGGTIGLQSELGIGTNGDRQTAGRAQPRSAGAVTLPSA